MKPNKTFELDIEDIQLIEESLHLLLNNLLIDDDRSQSKARKIHNLLGRLHNQKIGIDLKNICKRLVCLYK